MRTSGSTRSAGGSDRWAAPARGGAARRALELEAQYAAEAGEQAAGARMARMRLETGVIDARERRVAFEKPRDPERTVVLVAHPEGEGLQSAAEQERRVRVQRSAEVVGLVPDALDQLGTACDRARRSEEHTSELQSRLHLVCRLLLETKKTRPAERSR